MILYNNNEYISSTAEMSLMRGFLRQTWTWPLTSMLVLLLAANTRDGFLVKGFD